MVTWDLKDMDMMQIIHVGIWIGVHLCRSAYLLKEPALCGYNYRMTNITTNG